MYHLEIPQESKRADMQRHYLAKHTQTRFPCRFPGCETHFSMDNNRVKHERKHQLYHCHGTKDNPCNQIIQGTQNWIVHQKIHQPHPCPDPECDKGYTMRKSLLKHLRDAHTNNKQPRSSSQLPSMPITTVPSPEPIVDHETKLPISNEFRVPVVYKRDDVKGIGLTTKWTRDSLLILSTGLMVESSREAKKQ
ncbi:hypothetical protein BKA57DRAFT_452838, partial [Linnemannia elongata]